MSAVYHKTALLFLVCSVCGLAAWSWVLVDPNFTLIEHADWTAFREYVMQIGYFDRPFSSRVYLTLISLLSVSSFFAVLNPPKKIFAVAVFIGVIAGLFSYPALSHDLFNYIFDARILTHYGQNPYQYRALDFPTDPMLRFMHWTHRAYPYGPTYLLLSLIPSFLGMNMFSATFLLFKLLHVVLYLVVVRLLQKINQRAAAIFAFSPLVIVEGLINTHNDFVAVCLGIVGICFLFRKRNLLSLVLLMGSGLIKYLSLPLPLLSLGTITKSRVVCGITIHLKDVSVAASVGGICFLLLYLITHGEVHPWYFLNILVFLPYFQRAYLYAYPTVFALLMSYYPYVVGGEWGQGGDVGFKNNIIYAGASVNVLLWAIYLLISKVRRI